MSGAFSDFTGRELHQGKRGAIKADEPKALRRLGLDKDHWTMKVKGVGSSYWRVVGSLEELIEKAKGLKQRTLFGIGFARLLKNIKVKMQDYFCRDCGWGRWGWESFGGFLDLDYVRTRIK